jgi:protoporphyrinogen oxidase
MSEQYDIIVIGAGISGLSMAFEAKQAGMKVLVLEKEPRSGGCFQTEMAPHDEGMFWLEMGTHTCFNSYSRLLSILAKLGLTDQMQRRDKRPYRMLADGRLTSIPSRLHYFELLTHAWRLFFLQKDGKSVREYYRALVGPKNYADVFRHAFNAVMCQPADDAPADMLFRKRPRDKSVMRSYTFAEGLGRIISELEQRLDVKHGQCIQAIHHHADGLEIETSDSSYACGRLVCATPALAASRLLGDIYPEIAAQLNRMKEIEIESVGVVVKKRHLSLEPVAGIIAADGDFYSAVSRDIIDHPQLRGLTFHFKPGLLDDEAKLQRICSLLGIDRSSLAYVFHKANRLPAPATGRHQLMENIDALLAGKPLALVGNYFAGIAVEDCLERVESELARLQIKCSADAP